MAKKNRLEMFTVEGSTRFPMDMLRYDVCVPIAPEDVSAIEVSLTDPGPTKMVNLYAKSSDRRCTIGRWNSFGWQVVRGRMEDGEPWMEPHRLRDLVAPR